MKLKYTSVRNRTWKKAEGLLWKKAIENSGLDKAKPIYDIGEIILPLKFTVRRNITVRNIYET